MQHLHAQYSRSCFESSPSVNASIFRMGLPKARPSPCFVATMPVVRNGMSGRCDDLGFRLGLDVLGVKCS